MKQPPLNTQKTFDIYSEIKNEVLDITQKYTLLWEFLILFFFFSELAKV